MPQQRRLPTAERRYQIAGAALEIIALQGVRRLTAAALADRVGIADGTIFRHFRNKAEIIDAAIDLFEATLEESFPPPDGDPLDRLGAFIAKRLTLVRERPALLRLAFNDRLAEAAGAAGAERIHRLVQRSMTFVRGCLEQAQTEGQVTRDAPLQLLVWMVLGVVRGAAAGKASRSAGDVELSSASAEEVWKALECFLRSTTEHRRKKGEAPR